MRWAQSHIQMLQSGKTVQFRPKGNSMTGRINSGDLVTIEPTNNFNVGDAVLCTVKGCDYVHLIKAIDNDRYLIGNNKGRINGWTRKVYGKVVKVEK